MVERVGLTDLEVTSLRLEEPPKDLIIAAQRGNPDSINRLLGLCRPHLYRLLFKITANGNVAEDATQETCIKLQEKIAYYDPARPFLTWLFAVARNKTIDILRQEGHRNRNVISLSPHEYLMADPGPPVDELLQKEIDAKSIAQSCEQLPQNQRQVIQMTSFGGMTNSEVARELNIPLGTVKTRRRLALNKLRHILEPIL